MNIFYQSNRQTNPPKEILLWIKISFLEQKPQQRNIQKTNTLTTSVKQNTETTKKKHTSKIHKNKCKVNERNRKMCTKVDYFLVGHKLSWATAHFIRCNRIKMQSKQVLHNGIKRNKQTYVT